MSHLSEEAIKRHVTIYVRVFLALAILTVATVGVSYLKLPIVLAIVVALAIATVKASLVAGFFMHLVNEKNMIYLILVVVIFFFLSLLLLPAITSRGI